MGGIIGFPGKQAVAAIVACAFVASTVASPQADVKAPAGVEDAVTQDSLTLELALMLKTGADEAFLAGDLRAAHDAYCDADKEIPEGLRLSSGRTQTVALLKADIKYRLLLLENGIGFWGGARSLRPTLPGQHLTRMKSLLDEFEATGGEILQKVEKASKDDEAGQQASAIAIGLAGAARQELVKQSSLEVQQTFQEDREDVLGARVAQLHAQRPALEGQVASATDAAHHASAALEKVIADAVVRSTGAPPELVDAMRTGDFKNAVLEAAKGYVVDSDAFKTALADVDANVQQVAGYMKQGRDLVDRAKEKAKELRSYRNDIETAANTLRNPTIASLAQLGAQIYPRMPPTVRTRWTDAVLKAKPVSALVEMMDAVDDPHVAEQVRSAVTDYLVVARGEVVGQLRTAAEAYIPAHGGVEDLVATEGRLVQRAAAIARSTGDVRIVVDSISRTWADGFVGKLPLAARQTVIAAVGLKDEAALAQALRTRGLAAFGEAVRIENGTLIVSAKVDGKSRTAASIPLAEFIGIPPAARPDLPEGDLKGAVALTVRSLEAGTAALRAAVLRDLPNELLASAVRTASLPVNDGSDPAGLAAGSAKAWQSLSARLDGRSRDAVVRRIVEMQVGATYVEPQTQQGGRNEASAATGASDGRRPSDPKEAIAMAALTAAFPGIGTGAAIAVQIYASFNAFNEAIDQAQRAAAELQSNLAEELEVLDLRGEARLKQAVLGKEVEIAKIARSTALAQHAAYSAVIANLGNAAKKERRAAALRRSLYFYIAEQLRREYDGLDGALELWTPDGSIATRVRSDPQIVRLALDEDVHLYDWLERDRESTRSDVDGLILHWRQLYQLASAECFDIGCGGATQTRLGSVGQTASLTLGSLISPSDRRRLDDWRRTRSREELTISLTFAPGAPTGSRESPVLDQAWENVRVLDVRIGRNAKGGSASQINKIRMVHPGSGYAVRSGHAERTTLMKAQAQFFQATDGFTGAELSALATGAAVGNFSGYPFYTDWQLTLLPDPENWEVSSDDLQLRFGVHYNEKGAALDDRGVLRSRDDVDRRLGGAVPRELAGSQIFSYLIKDASHDAAGSTRRERDPPGIDLPDPMVALLYHPKAAMEPCPVHDGRASRPAGVAASAPLARPLHVVRRCRPDAELKRNLLSAYLQGRHPDEAASTSRRKAAAGLAALKAGACMAELDLPIGEAH